MSPFLFDEICLERVLKGQNSLKFPKTALKVKTQVLCPNNNVS